MAQFRSPALASRRNFTNSLVRSWVGRESDGTGIGHESGPGGLALPSSTRWAAVGREPGPAGRVTGFASHCQCVAGSSDRLLFAAVHEWIFVDGAARPGSAQPRSWRRSGRRSDANFGKSLLTTAFVGFLAGEPHAILPPTVDFYLLIGFCCSPSCKQNFREHLRLRTP
jgi:hypothetical protein